MASDEYTGADSFHTVSHVATRLNVSRMTVYRMIHAGEITASRIRNSLRISETTVARYLQEATLTASCKN